jgi:hypothetical protein
MTNNNHKNTDCGFAEQMVSYLYGETDAGETAAFEAHLQTCANCTDEFEAFSGVHFSINDWKAKEFDPLATPSIEIPYEKRPEKAGLKDSWLSGLRGILSLSPAWSLATASLAVLAVTAGLLLLQFPNSKVNQPIAKQQTPTPPTEKNAEQKNASSNQNRSPDNAVKPVNEPQSPKPDVVVENNPKNIRVGKTNQRQAQKPENKNTPRNDDVRRNNKNDKVPPGVIEDDEEDDTLRLAEIFDEIDTDE